MLFCCSLSLSYGLHVLGPSITLIFLTVLYNDLRASAGHCLIRNIFNAVGLAVHYWQVCDLIREITAIQYSEDKCREEWVVH